MWYICCDASWHAYSITSSTRIELSNHKEKIVTPEEWPIKRDHISIYILITNLDGNSMSGKIVRAPKQATSVWKKTRRNGEHDVWCGWRSHPISQGINRPNAASSALHDFLPPHQKKHVGSESLMIEAYFNQPSAPFRSRSLSSLRTGVHVPHNR